MEKENHRSTLPVQPAETARPLGSEDEIDLVELFYVLWGHVWQIALCLILGAALAFGYTYFLAAPQYRATSSIYIVSASNNSVVNLTDLQIGAQLTADYQELMLSRPLLEDVIQNLGLDLSTGSLANMISISNASDTRILKITVTSSNPQLSADIANELVNQACIYLPQIMETEEPNLVESAIPPAAPSGPSYPKNTVFGALAGALLCCVVLVVRYLMNDTFVTPDDVTRYLGIQPLATIPEADLGDFNQRNRKRGLKRKEKAK